MPDERGPRKPTAHPEVPALCATYAGRVNSTRWRGAPFAALLGALVAGIVMSLGQTISPDGWSPLFNSGTPVVTVCAAAAWWGARGSRALGARAWALHAALGAAAGPLTMVGYYGTGAIRGFGVWPASVLFWCVAGVVLGGAMGSAVWALGAPVGGTLRGLAAGLWPGVAMGEAAHGNVRIADTTPVAYWWTLAFAGAVALAIITARHVSGAVPRLVAIASTAVVALAVFVVYGG